MPLSPEAGRERFPATGPITHLERECSLGLTQLVA
jgi:hypothetical protein